MNMISSTIYSVLMLYKWGYICDSMLVHCLIIVESLRQKMTPVSDFGLHFVLPSTPM